MRASQLGFTSEKVQRRTQNFPHGKRGAEWSEIGAANDRMGMGSKTFFGDITSRFFWVIRIILILNDPHLSRLSVLSLFWFLALCFSCVGTALTSGRKTTRCTSDDMSISVKENTILLHSTDQITDQFTSRVGHLENLFYNNASIHHHLHHSCCLLALVTFVPCLLLYRAHRLLKNYEHSSRHRSMCAVSHYMICKMSD
jgi:hypothetical protein